MATYASSTTLLPGQIAYEAGAEARDALAALGRTEDVRFSPSGARLASACYARDQIAVAEVEISRHATGVEVAVADLVFHDSPAIREPHGLDFVDERTLVVAARGGNLVVLRLPEPGVAGGARTIASVSCELGAVGSVAVRPLATGEAEVLAVHNWANAVTRYRFANGDSVAGGDVVLESLLDLPDGLSASKRGDWLAVSNHASHDVLVFGAHALHPEAEPVGVLRGVAYPHGLRFADDDRLLLVADAGAPYVSVFARPTELWAGAAYPQTAIRVMDDATYAAGRHNPQEGGPKGIDVDPRANVLVVTAEKAPLAFFDLDVVLGLEDTRPAEDLVRYELEQRRSVEHARTELEGARARLNAVLQTKAWRLTGPVRAAYGALRRRGS